MHAGIPPPGKAEPQQGRSPGKETPPGKADPPVQGHPPCAVHAGRYGQQVGGMHPTEMQSC